MACTQAPRRVPILAGQKLALVTPDATLSFRVAFEPKDSYIFARGQNIRIILPKPKELFELFGFEAKKRVRTATKI